MPYQRTEHLGSVRLTLTLAILTGLAAASPSMTSCPWEGTDTAMCNTIAGPFESCFRILTASQPCQVAMNNNMGTVCLPADDMGAMTLFASQSNSGLQVDAYCQWQCGGQTCRIDLADGLPVELMGFSIEDEDSASGEVKETETVGEKSDG